jgi:hydroxymethylpyrimidine/phosphomethylpyrimidine kinase
VLGVQAASPENVRLQLEAVWTELPPAALKTGMLYSTAIIRVVVEFLETLPKLPPLVVDPVMVATSGAQLLKPGAIRLLQERLLRLCDLATPNLDEAALLTGRTLKEPEDLRWAARELHNRFGCAALIKGGHLQGTREAIDIFFDGKQELMLMTPYVRGVSTHGTGCTYSAAITAELAKGASLTEAVSSAKTFISRAIAGSQKVARHSVLGFLVERSPRKKQTQAHCGRCGCGAEH